MCQQPMRFELGFKMPGLRRLWNIGWAFLLAGALARVCTAEEPLQYNRDIRPILADACFPCHGPDSASRKADLRLDQRQTAIDMAAIDPSDPDNSEMIRRILSNDSDEIMPPPETKKTLTGAQQEKLQRWIREGAQYQLHWSFIAPQRPAPPQTARPDWVGNPIDAFILARLEAAGLDPEPEADRRSLARRVALDLTGLPPSPELVQSFVEDASPRAYEKLVDQLVGSRAWGEHRARYWLDYARYADTHGIHFDNFREMWTYRDWVIAAFNQNMPFDQFTMENLAGDLLPNATLEQKIGSGFNRCNMTTNEGGIIDEEYLVLYTRDRIETTSQIWMGLTANCAVCHSHKFDPLSQREFYAMAAFFNNTTQTARDGNIKDTPPILIVPLEQDRQRWDALPQELTQARHNVALRRADAKAEYTAWLQQATPESLGAPLPSEQLYLHAPLSEAEGRTTRILVSEKPRDVSLLDSVAWGQGPSRPALELQGAACRLEDACDFDADQPLTCAAWLKLPASDGQGAICARMDNDDNYRGWDFWTQRRQVGMHVISQWPDDGLKVVGKEQIAANQWVHVTVSYDGSGKAEGVKIYYDGKPQAAHVERNQLNGSIRTNVPFSIGQRSKSESLTGSLADLRIYQRVLAPAEVESLARLSRFQSVLAKQPDQRTEQETEDLFEYWLRTQDQPFQALEAQVVQLEREQQEVQARGTIAHVMQEKPEPAMAYVLNRGEYDQRRDPVTPDTPAVLPPFPSDAPRNRLGFARWLLLPEHPLTARVTVNRCWQEVFGVGIVKTAGDLGVSGELPSHPELLDWLAVEFRESGWDVKHLYKLMVMSSTYRQSARTTPEKRELDPENRLLSRGPRFRMDGEMVRDLALSVSGLLVEDIGGPSVKPYQPEGVWEAIAMNVSNTRKYEPGAGDDLYRRSLYTFVKRMAPPASLEIFNAPSREFCVVRRERTNTPLQALVTLNDEQFVEAARCLAQAAMQAAEQTDARLDYISQRLLSRAFRGPEKSVIADSLHQLLDYYRQHPEDAQHLIAVGESKPADSLDTAELAGWTMLANELMNLDEALNK